MNSISSFLSQYGGSAQSAGFNPSSFGGNMRGRMPEGIQNKLQEAGISPEDFRATMKSKVQEKIKSQMGESGGMSPFGNFQQMKADMEGFHAKLEEAGMTPQEFRSSLKSQGYTPESLLSGLTSNNLSLDKLLQSVGNHLDVQA